jgi:hypothetical protein
MFKLHGKQWISAAEHTEDAVAKDGVEVEASKATATIEIRDWLSTAFGELTVAPATCAPRYLAVTEMVCQVNREIRELEAAHWPRHEAYCDVYKRFCYTKDRRDILWRAYDTEEKRTKLVLQELIVACLGTVCHVRDREQMYDAWKFTEPAERKRRMLWEIEDLHMWNQDQIFSALRKVLVDA